VVVDEGGNIISISRMEHAPPAGIGVSRAKAYLAAVTQVPTAGFSTRMDAHPTRFAAYQEILSEKPFPGPGGMPIKKNGRVVGGLSTGPGIGPVTRVEGVDPGKLKVDGQQANAEDLIICYALQVPYKNQHEGQES